MKRYLSMVAVGALFFLAGCDTRNTHEKLTSPTPEFITRYTMACPECGAPQKPYRITELKSYYRCAGLPPKFPYHDEHKWEHTLAENDSAAEQ